MQKIPETPDRKRVTYSQRSNPLCKRNKPVLFQLWPAE